MEIFFCGFQSHHGAARRPAGSYNTAMSINFARLYQYDLWNDVFLLVLCFPKCSYGNLSCVSVNPQTIHSGSDLREIRHVTNCFSYICSQLVPMPKPWLQAPSDYISDVTDVFGPIAAAMQL